MSRVPHLAAGLTASLLLLPGCTPTERAAGPVAPATKGATHVRATPPATGTVLGLVEHDGMQLAEIPLGSDHGLEVGSLLRIYGSIGDQTVFKGMVQVTEVAGAKRCFARSIGLTDRSSPLLIGDQARVADLGSAYADFRRDLAADRQNNNQQVEKEDAAFASVRENYQSELALAAGRFSEQREKDLAQHDQEIEAITLAHSAEMDRMRAEHQAEIAALRTTFSQEAQAALEADRKARADRITALKEQVAALTANSDGIATQLTMARQAAIDLQKRLDAQEQRHAAEVKAEVETRQILEQRLAVAQPGTSATTSSPKTILTLDPARTETVLGRLDRANSELAAAQQRVADLEKALADASALAKTSTTDLGVAKERIATLESLERKAGSAGERIIDLEHQLDLAKDLAARHELARLEAERQIFDITARLLAAEDTRSVDDLRERLRQHVASIQAQAGKGP